MEKERIAFLDKMMLICIASALPIHAQARSNAIVADLSESGADFRTPENTDQLTISDLLAAARLEEENGDSFSAEQWIEAAFKNSIRTNGRADSITLEISDRYVDFLKNNGKPDLAIDILRDNFAIAITNGEFDSELASKYRSALVSHLVEQRRLNEAAPLMADQLLILKSGDNPHQSGAFLDVYDYASLLARIGRQDEAVLLYAELVADSRALLGADHPNTLIFLQSYVQLLSDLDRQVDVNRILAEMVQMEPLVSRKFTDDNVHIAQAYANLLSIVGRQQEAAALFDKIIPVQLKGEYGAAHPFTFTALEDYSRTLELAGRIKEAITVSHTIVDNSTKYRGKNDIETAIRKIDLARLLSQARKYQLAQILFDDGSDTLSRHLSKNDPYIWKTSNLLVKNLLRSGGSLDRATSITRTTLGEIATELNNSGFSLADDQRRTALAEINRNTQVLFADTAWLARPNSDETEIETIEQLDPTSVQHEVFTTLQDTQNNAAAIAISQTAARRAAGRISKEMEILALQRHSLSVQWVAVDNALAESLAGNDPADQNRRNMLRVHRDRLQEQMRSIDERLHDEAPDYFELIRPKSLNLRDVQKLMGQDDAALLVVPGDFGTHIMLISGGKLLWSKSGWTENEVNDAVRRLLWDAGANVVIDVETEAKWLNEGDGIFPFDRRTAHDLYNQLIAPVASGLSGKRHLFISASGSLSSIPFSLLVTEKPVGADGDPQALRETSWLADAHALIQIPSLQSIKFLREFRQQSNASDNDVMFQGFGDPVLDGKNVQRGANVKQRKRVSSLATSAAFLAGQNGSGAGLVNIDAIRSLPRLPGTAAEILAMSQVFGSSESNIFLGKLATETNLRATDLSQTRILAIATHGLLGGEIEGQSEPGLVFTPPAQASEYDDGLLTASEITSLRLNADWVILSACNTAAGDGSQGSPGLSGLARSFFYAGARNLLASHWPVLDDVAAKLTVRMIKIAQANPQMSRAEALQQSIREIRNDTRADSDLRTWAHPSAWAPFVLIGDR